jgi:hypothetical protein
MIFEQTANENGPVLRRDRPWWRDVKWYLLGRVLPVATEGMREP